MYLAHQTFDIDLTFDLDLRASSMVFDLDLKARPMVFDLDL